MDDITRLVQSIEKARSGNFEDMLEPQIQDIAARLYQSTLQAGNGDHPFGVDISRLAVLAEYHFLRHEAAAESTDDGTDLDRALSCLLRMYLADSSLLTEAGRRMAEDLLRNMAASAGATTWSRNVGEMLSAARRTGSPALINQVIARARVGAELATPGTAERSALLADLSAALQSRFFHTGDVADLSEAIEVTRVATRETPAGQAMWSLCWNNLGASLRVRYEATGDLADLDESIRAFRTVADDRATVTSPAHIGAVSNLGVALRQRYEVRGDAEDIDEAVARSREALTLANDIGLEKRELLSNLAAALGVRNRINATTRVETDDNADEIALLRQAIAEPAPDVEQDQVDRQRLALALRRRFERGRRPEDIVEAIALLRALTSDATSSPHGLPIFVNSLAGALLAQLRASEDGSDDAEKLESEALRMARWAVELTPAGHYGHGTALIIVRDVLHHRWQRCRSSEDLNEIIALDQSVVAGGPPAGWPLAVNLNWLGVDLSVRYRSHGDRADFDAAMAAYRAAANAAPSGHAEHARALALSALAQQEESEQVAGVDHLDAAIAGFEAALDVTPRDDPEWAHRAFLKSVNLRIRYERAGNLADLNESVRLGRLAVAASTDSDIIGEMLSHLGASLRTRHQRLGDSQDLRLAIAIGRSAVMATRSAEIGHAVALSHLSLAYLLRENRWHDPVDLDLAVELGRAAIAAEESDSSASDRALHLSNLATMLHRRAASDRHVALFRDSDYREAVDATRLAVSLEPVNSPNRPRYLNNLGQVLLAAAHHEDSLTPERLDEVTNLLREAVTLTAANHPDFGGRQFGLGHALLLKYFAAVRGSGRAADVVVRQYLEEALSIWRSVAEAPAVPAHLRIDAAWRWGATAAGNLEDRAAAIAGFTAAIDLLPVLASRGLTRSDREAMLSHWPGLASSAAAAALSADLPEVAVELLEGGRAVLWSQAPDLGATLAAEHPIIAARLKRLRELLDGPDLSGEPMLEVPTP
ncbi:hypothetical protein [Micromonospora taraxaci]|uniref:hypothetical protein n=1 Tax=Micromonospora taraxaci TaxID=1316803 RepID=UPI0033A18A15